MDTKLTLRLDKAVIEKAKIYANSKQISLSKMIENYLQSILEKEKDEFEISPFIQSMTVKNALPLDIDVKEEYLKHAETKHR